MTQLKAVESQAMTRVWKLLKAMLAASAAAAVSACAALGPEQFAGLSHETVTQDGNPVRLAYRETGSGDPVVLIHGFGANAYTWRHIEPALAKAHRVISIDLKGFGQSEKPLDKRYSVRDQAALISQFMAQKKLTNATVVGHSLGGGVALVLALEESARTSRRIKRVALIDSVAYAQKIPLAFSILRAPVIGPLTNFLIPKDLQARTALRVAYHDDSKFDEKDVDEYAAPLRDHGSQHAMIYSARQILPENIDALAARYPTITIPALVIWCDHDKVVRPHIGWRLHGDLPNSKFALIKGCGHVPQEERPEETARLLLDFLNR